MRHKLLLLTILALSTMALLAIASWVSSKTPVQAAASDPARIYVIVQNSGGTSINNATVTLTIGPVVVPPWCGYAGKNGTWAGISTNSDGQAWTNGWPNQYWFWNGPPGPGWGNVLQICCNANSFSVSVSAPGYEPQAVNLAGFLVNGAGRTLVVTLNPTPPVNQPPIGSIDRVDCALIGGWARDPDTGAPIKVRIYAGSVHLGDFN